MTKKKGRPGNQPTGAAPVGPARRKKGLIAGLDLNRPSFWHNSQVWEGPRREVIKKIKSFSKLQTW